MSVLLAPTTSRERATAVLSSGCDGYQAGTTGIVIGQRDGCVVFAPHHPENVAKWAMPRAALLVPPSLIVTVR